ncbi:MAG: M56 family metallopeptidase [Planctomycetota bacterium]|nr:M56 family metallopeptidase [Planctomycetota bacterium]
MSAFVRSFAEAFGAQVVQIAAVFALVLVLDLLVARRGSAGLRAALWGAFFVKLVVPPSLTTPWSLARLFENDAETAAKPYFPVSETLLDDCALIAIGVWAIGCGACFVVAIRRMRDSRLEWLADSKPASDLVRRRFEGVAARVGTRRLPCIRMTETLGGGASIGLWSPIIVVPTSLVNADAFEHVVLHELAHVRRRDGLRAAAWTIARCVYWFHPLVHIGARRAALVRELACDEFAAQHAVGGARDYQRTLVELARPLAGVVAATTAFAGASSMIGARLERLERASTRSRREVLPSLVFALMCVCCIPLGSRAKEVALPSFSEAEGCMRKRFIVLTELAQQNHAADRSAGD